MKYRVINYLCSRESPEVERERDRDRGQRSARKIHRKQIGTEIHFFLLFRKMSEQS